MDKLSKSSQFDENEDSLNIESLKRPHESNEDYYSPKKLKNDKQTNPSSNSSIKKTFPGPAGTLFNEENIKTLSQIDIFSPTLKDNSWKEMSKDFKISDDLHLYSKFNIAWLKKEATNHQFTHQKAPFLAATLKTLEVCDLQTQKSVNITLKDRTGTIQANILYNLYEEYASYLTLGCVLVLIHFGVLSCSCKSCQDQHHLVITPNNLCAIYKGQEKLIINKIEPQKILLDYSQKKKETLLTSTSPLSISRPPIFSLMHCNEEKFSLPKIRGIGKTTSDISGCKSVETGSRKAFTFKKMPSSNVSEKVTTNSCNKLGGVQSSEFSSAEDEKIWEDTLGDVDLKSLFDGDDD